MQLAIKVLTARSWRFYGRRREFSGWLCCATVPVFVVIWERWFQVRRSIVSSFSVWSLWHDCWRSTDSSAQCFATATPSPQHVKKLDNRHREDDRGILLESNNLLQTHRSGYPGITPLSVLVGKVRKALVMEEEGQASRLSYTTDSVVDNRLARQISVGVMSHCAPFQDKVFYGSVWYMIGFCWRPTMSWKYVLRLVVRMCETDWTASTRRMRRYWGKRDGLRPQPEDDADTKVAVVYALRKTGEDCTCIAQKETFASSLPLRAILINDMQCCAQFRCYSLVHHVSNSKVEGKLQRWTALPYFVGGTYASDWHWDRDEEEVEWDAV